MSKLLIYEHQTTIERNGQEYPCVIEYYATPEEIEAIAARDADGVEFTLSRKEVRFYQTEIAEALMKEVA